MPLPVSAPNTPWPPDPAKGHLADVAEWDAWYSGDVRKLGTIYGGQSAPPSERSRFWARRRQQQQGTQYRHAVHLPAAADIAGTSADLLFGDQPRLVIPEAHDDQASTEAKATEARLEELVDTDGIDMTLLEAADVASGLGGVYLRLGWDREIAPDHPLLTVVHPDFAIPEFVGRHLRAVTFWREVRVDGQAIWRHLERHEGRVVEHGLYIGTTTHLGQRVDLDRHPDTASLDSDMVPVPDGVQGLLVRYWPNRPNRRRRNSPQGAADCSEAISLMDALDETYSSWMRDIRLGRLRIIADREMLVRAGRGGGAHFDTDQEIFTPVDMGPVSMDKGQHPITPVSFDVRWEAHQRSAAHLFEAVARSAGYSPQTFGLQGDGGRDQTATEVDAREDRSLRTTGKKRRYSERPVVDTIHNLLVLDATMFRSGVDASLRPRIEWPDPAGDDLNERAETLSRLELARAASVETKVRMLNPSWEKAEVKAEVERIYLEQGYGQVPDPTGGDPDGGE